jgi:glycosyltransferase involved in cell wall biosynthesis
MPSQARQILVLLYERYERDSRVRRHVRALTTAGYLVRIVAVGADGAAQAARDDGGTLRPIGHAKYRGGSRISYILAYLAFTVRAAMVVARADPRRVAAVWVNAPPDLLVFAALLARVRGVPVILDVHDISSDLYAAKFGGGASIVGAFVRVAEWLAWRAASAIVTVHAPYRARIAGRVPGKPIIDILNVPDSESWYEIGSKRTAAGARGGSIATAGNELRLGHHGTIAARFGVDLAVRAVAALRRDGVPVRLELLGDGDHAADVQGLIGELGMRDHIHFDRRTFSPDEVADFCARIDVGVAPYRDSPFIDQILPVKVLEYLALGVPVVATGTSVLRRYVPSDAVRYVTPASEATVAEAVRELLDPARRAALAAAGHAALASMSWPEQRRRLLAWLDEFVIRPSPG